MSWDYAPPKLGSVEAQGQLQPPLPVTVAGRFHYVSVSVFSLKYVMMVVLLCWPQNPSSHVNHYQYFLSGYIRYRYRQTPSAFELRPYWYWSLIICSRNSFRAQRSRMFIIGYLSSSESFLKTFLHWWRSLSFLTARIQCVIHPWSADLPYLKFNVQLDVTCTNLYVFGLGTWVKYVDL